MPNHLGSPGTSILFFFTRLNSSQDVSKHIFILDRSQAIGVWVNNSEQGLLLFQYNLCKAKTWREKVREHAGLWRYFAFVECIAHQTGWLLEHEADKKL